MGAAVFTPWLDKAVQELSLPLRHEDIIRQQAADKDLDPALIAAVIYAESHFVDQTSHAGAKGLMQMLPEHRRLHRPASRAARGSSRATSRRRRSTSPTAAGTCTTCWRSTAAARRWPLAAYNAGEGKLDEWLATAAARGQTFSPAEHIPFPETRDYVDKVLTAKAQYRREYARELGY